MSSSYGCAWRTVALKIARTAEGAEPPKRRKGGMMEDAKRSLSFYDLGVGKLSASGDD